MASDYAEPRVLSYLAVRRALGLLGLALPLVLWLYATPYGGGMRPSISEFYHSHMGDVFVGILCAIGVFLFSYQGYPRQPGERLSDKWVAMVAGLGALGVALFPVRPPDAAVACDAGPRYDVMQGVGRIAFNCPVAAEVHWRALPILHFASALVFFVCLAIFALVLFPKGRRRADGRIRWTAPENLVYLLCGLAILTAIVALGVYAGLTRIAQETAAALRARDYVFWWETVAVVAFAVSWLVKGKTLRGLRNAVGV